ncbi:hypothetical protein BC567DRAFT_42013 [Phyllosticta citribraziliensis]
MRTCRHGGRRKMTAVAKRRRCGRHTAVAQANVALLDVVKPVDHAVVAVAVHSGRDDDGVIVQQDLRCTRPLVRLTSHRDHHASHHHPPQSLSINVDVRDSIRILVLVLVRLVPILLRGHQSYTGPSHTFSEQHCAGLNVLVGMGGSFLPSPV